MTVHGLDTSFLVAHEVSRHALHRRARACCEKLLMRGDRLALAPQVLAELIHVVTDDRRFAAPLLIEAAVERASTWWHANEVLPIYPSGETTRLFLDWLTQFRLHFGDFDPFGDFVLLFGASKLSLKILDIPVRYRERFYGRTNIHRWKHGWLLVQMLAFAALKLKFL
jgi:predicted nucleic acid-binding protein